MALRCDRCKKERERHPGGWLDKRIAVLEEKSRFVDHVIVFRVDNFICKDCYIEFSSVIDDWWKIKI